MKKIILLLFAILLSGISARAQEAVRKSVEIDIYNDAMGVVKERRIVNLKKGISEITIDSLPLDLNFELLALNIDATVLEQKYDDNYNSASIIGRFNPGDTMTYKDWKTVYTERFLSYDGYNCIFLDSNNSIHRIAGVPEIILKNNHEFGNKLTIKVDANKSGEQEFEIIYKSDNFRYYFEYTAIFADTGTKMDLKSQILIRNYSNIDYMNAKVRIMKGEYYSLTGLISLCSTFALIPAPATYSSSNHKQLFDYHIIDIEKPVTIKNNSETIINYFAVENVEYKKHYSCLFWEGKSIWEFSNYLSFSFKNDFKDGLGFNMYKGNLDLILSNILIGGEYRRELFHHTNGENVYIGGWEDPGIQFELLSERITPLSDSLEEKTVEIKAFNYFKNEDVELSLYSPGLRTARITYANIHVENGANDEATLICTIPRNSKKIITFKLLEERRKK